MESGLLRSLTTLSDMARLRLLRLMEKEELGVGELARILQLPQSTVSRHLKLLHDGGWVAKRSEGTASLYRMEPSSLDGADRALWNLVRDRLGLSPTLEQDDHRMAEVLAERPADGRTFFGRLGEHWDRLRHELFGDAFTCEALIGLLDPGWIVADLGCGTGPQAEHLAPYVARILAVDREPSMLEAARRRLASFTNVEFLQDDVTRLSIGAGKVDAAIASLVMAYVPRPLDAVREAARILRRGGRFLIVDMVAHDRESYRHTLGHQHLGFDEATVRVWAESAGLTFVRYHRLPPDTEAKGPGLFAATLAK